MFKPTTSRTTLGGVSASLPSSSSQQEQEIAPLQEATAKERIMRRFEAELEKLKDQGKRNENEPAASSPMNPAQKLPNSAAQLDKNEKYAKALLVAVREEAYKKGYKSSNKLRAAPPGVDANQWIKKERKRCTMAYEEVGRIRAKTSSEISTNFLAIQYAIDAKGHNCLDISLAGVGILAEAGIKDANIITFADLDHVTILIGEMPSAGLPLGMEKWPSHLAICDPWANIACPAQEYISTMMKKMQKWESDGKKIYDHRRQTWKNPAHSRLEQELRGRYKLYGSLAEKNARDAKGRTQLMIAAETGDVDDMRILLKAGVDIESKDHDGRTALVIAAQKGNTTAMEVLLKAGANIETKDKDGPTALTMADDEGKIEAMEILFKAGMNLDEKDNAGPAQE